MPLAVGNEEIEGVAATEKQDGPQSLLNIEPPSAPEIPQAPEPAVEESWVELPPAGETQKQPQAAAETPAPLIMQERQLLRVKFPPRPAVRKFPFPKRKAAFRRICPRTKRTSLST